jgi:AmmeMemoRadiSam system protein A
MLRLSNAGRDWLLLVAREALAAAACGKRYRPPNAPSHLSPADREELEHPRAAFVTLHHDGQLRGCIGHTATDTPLRLVVAEMTSAAALEDSRFPPVTPAEVPGVELEISVLSPFFPISPDQIVPGVHGLVIQRGLHRGLLLPQVATTYNWDAGKLLEETCRKAGLPSEAWKHGASIQAFTAELIRCDRPPACRPLP